METIVENKNILEILEEKLELFRNKKTSLEENLLTKRERTIQIQSEISQLQNLLAKNEREIGEDEKELEKNSEFLREIENGYNTIVESGNCLMEIVKNADK
jgi:flagellar biosynthesis chaperone FliJ